MPRVSSIAELEKLREEIKSKRRPDKPCIAICHGTACHAYGCERIGEAFQEELRKQGLENKIDIRNTGCHGFCEKGTLVVIYPEEICYLQVKSEDVSEIVQSIMEKKIVNRLLYTNQVTYEKVVKESEIPFYKHQQRLVFGPNRWINPRNIEDYLYIGGYSALSKVLSQMRPVEVIEEVKMSNLRGRGGAGFPTGVKWETAKNAPGEPKYVIVNCDEGDPGAYMDRSLMEGNPHSVLEGLLIGAYAIGSSEGVIYVRMEYPLAVTNSHIAITQANEYGFLGKNILGTGFNFNVRVHYGAGAFVCGEETAMISAIEGKPGEPRLKYVYPAIRGLKNKPTNINNVETWANVPLIINSGAEWFNAMGTEGSKGTKIFSLVGKVNNTGLVEVPMGISLREIVYDIGGGIPDKKKFKAIQIGGPSGGVVPEQHLDTPIDFDELNKLGAMMGSGGLVVMDEDTCIVNTASYFIDFCLEESCGQCIPCREGLTIMREYLHSIIKGNAEEGTIEAIRDVAELLRDASLCALGTTAANPVLTSLEYFKNEYEDHVKQKRCGAKVCPDLITYCIDSRACETACILCIESCPSKAVQGRKGIPKWIEDEKCAKCGICLESCLHRVNAVAKFTGGDLVPRRFLKKGVI